jgi:hypothetical protein
MYSILLGLQFRQLEVMQSRMVTSVTIPQISMSMLHRPLVLLQQLGLESFKEVIDHVYHP